MAIFPPHQADHGMVFFAAGAGINPHPTPVPKPKKVPGGGTAFGPGSGNRGPRTTPYKY